MSAAFLLLVTTATQSAPVADLAVPPGFAVSLYADNPLAADITTMTIDDAGRVLVAGRGYVRVLVDDNGDGIADRAIDLVDGLTDAPMGLLAEGDSLYVVADGGLKQYRGYNGKDKLKGPPETLLALETTGEHDAHAVRRGPDGWLYLLCGNMAGVKKETITSRRSPVKDPVAGTLLRISPDGTQLEVVADGFRNPYSFDFNADGEPFTYDSDNERCVGLPWYEPCRFYHVVPGGNYGWRSTQFGQFWRKPPYFIDCVPPVCYLGRGSPTGVACYRHTHFPEKYRRGFFLADWTFGRIHFVPLTPSGSTYAGKPEVFAEAKGESGFAPTALAVHPKTGELYVSIGGRGTRGGVYRIGHKTNPAGEPLPTAKRVLEGDKEAVKQWTEDCASDDARARRIALELLLRGQEYTRWTTGLADAVKPSLSHADPLVRLAAARAVKGLILDVATPSDPEARLALALMGVRDNPEMAVKVALAILDEPPPKGATFPWNGGQLFAETDRETEDRLRYVARKLQALRIVQLALGDLGAPGAVGTVFEGYTLRKPVSKTMTTLVVQSLKPRMDPFGSDSLPRVKPLNPYRPDLLHVPVTHIDRELGRIIAGLEGGEETTAVYFAAWLGQAIARAADVTHLRDDIHFMACLARLGPNATRDEDRILAKTLLGLEAKRQKLGVVVDTFWPLRVNELAGALIPDSRHLRSTIITHTDFGRPEHVPFAKHLDRKSAEVVPKFLAAAEKDKDYGWTPSLVALVGELPPEGRRPVLLTLWDRVELRDAILRVLPPQAGDVARFVSGLASFDPEVVRISAAALGSLTPQDTTAELVAAVKALRRLAPEDKAAREAVAGLLKGRTNQPLGTDPKAWTAWLTKNYPEAAKALATANGFDAAAWAKRTTDIPWDKGEAARGRFVFTKASCAACHDGGRALGPSLLGVAKRFSRDDLLTAVVQPNKDVSARYRATRIATTDDKVHVGMLVYEATDGVILQTNADTAVRVPGASIASKRPVELSLMPAGLLDKLTDAEVADLFAYLKSLDEPKSK